MPESTEDALRRLEERLAQASGAAERLFAEAAAQAASAALRHERRPPPQGWKGAGEQREGDLEVLLGAVEALGELIPPDLRHRLAEAVHEMLLAARALIDWCLERTASRSDEPPEVEDIPVL